MSGEKKEEIPEIIIISRGTEKMDENGEISKKDREETNVGFMLYDKFTGDKNYEPPKDIHPSSEKKIDNITYKIHFFDNQDSYWPAMSNICRRCKGAVIAIDIENYTEEYGTEFIKEWLINFEDLDVSEMQTVIVGVSKSNSTEQMKGRNEVQALADEKKIDLFWIKITQSKTEEIEEIFKKLANLIRGKNDIGGGNADDNGMDEYLDKYKNF